MKKLLTLIWGGLLLLSTPVFAQDGLVIGGKIGANLANIAGDLDNDIRIAYHFGGFAQLQLTEKIELQSEAVISSQGHDPKTISDNKLKLTYLNIPILARYNASYNINIHAGPQIGILLSAKSEFQGNDFDAKDSFDTVDVGFAIGAGLDFLDKFNATIRYVAGLVNISSDINPGDRKNSVIQVSLGVKLIKVGVGAN